MIGLTAACAVGIRAHGGEMYPEECCGALLGSQESSGARVTRIERTVNSRGEERGHRFRIAPEEYGRVERLAEALGLALLGFYHSHPDHPAVPSGYDREHALPFFHYLVLAVISGRPGELTSWVLSEDRGVFEHEKLVFEAPEE
ncbi:MAG TPA: M67 family metallopeptidase [Thermoanaerobaculia bacterium]|nr:M67 family metallopeptidase [Thermoanaerobaculia bacterium]